MCGDDEDPAFALQSLAAMYYTTLPATGYELNPNNQLAAFHNHQFLQGIRVETPQYTLLATGIWYTQSGT